MWWCCFASQHLELWLVGGQAKTSRSPSPVFSFLHFCCCCSFCNVHHLPEMATSNQSFHIFFLFFLIAEMGTATYIQNVTTATSLCIDGRGLKTVSYSIYYAHFICEETNAPRELPTLQAFEFWMSFLHTALWKFKVCSIKSWCMSIAKWLWQWSIGNNNAINPRPSRVKRKIKELSKWGFDLSKEEQDGRSVLALKGMIQTLDGICSWKTLNP